MNEVIVLYDGYSNKLDDDNMSANCTCTLIKGEKNIIVDTMTAWDREKIITALQSQNVLPENIDYVICTHGHPDHIGNNNLFTNAKHFIGSTLQTQTIFRTLKPETRYECCKGIEIIQTPGHTYDDVTVLVDSVVDGENAVIAITGDLFEKEADISMPIIWQELGIPELQSIQATNRSKVATQAHYIIPGHGPMFKVTPDMKKLLTC